MYGLTISSLIVLKPAFIPLMLFSTAQRLGRALLPHEEFLLAFMTHMDGLVGSCDLHVADLPVVVEWPVEFPELHHILAKVRIQNVAQVKLEAVPVCFL